MKPVSIAGIVLVVLGALALASIHATTDEQHHVPVPPILGAIVLLG